MKNIILFLALLLIPLKNSVAVNVGNITEIMSTDEDFLAKEIENTVDTARLVNLTVDKIDSPLENGNIISAGDPNEILTTPANLILPGKAKDIFRIIYKGPKDDKERYYRLNWKDDPIGESGVTKSSKSASATTSATISTILVVAPRIEKFDYQYKNSQVSNIGNSSFRVVASGPCLPEKQKSGVDGICRERYYLMPNLAVKLQFVDLANKKSSVGIWHKGEFIVVK
ncbi:fimbrial protein [Providencia burhodogranariea]|uniref:Probable fimbrial chaperone EcpB n=1 Tax=Providencia burhodogranariea DSM 19968 TaxID=1141662 RepID=K8WF42_9GAMM|nr:fimbrial protein [Providencia burhodogranariea]EKT56092.1 fimbrial protein [Providencia burhodogranariea DSM 19968]